MAGFTGQVAAGSRQDSAGCDQAVSGIGQGQLQRVVGWFFRRCAAFSGHRAG